MSVDSRILFSCLFHSGKWNLTARLCIDYMATTFCCFGGVLMQSKIFPSNEGISAASFCPQVAALVPDMFFNSYLVKNHKSANTSPNTDAREK
jgi:hypothetical protein